MFLYSREGNAVFEITFEANHTIALVAIKKMTLDNLSDRFWNQSDWTGLISNTENDMASQRQFQNYFKLLLKNSKTFCYTDVIMFL